MSSKKKETSGNEGHPEDQDVALSTTSLHRETSLKEDQQIKIDPSKGETSCHLKVSDVCSSGAFGEEGSPPKEGESCAAGPCQQKGIRAQNIVCCMKKKWNLFTQTPCWVRSLFFIAAALLIYPLLSTKIELFLCPSLSKIDTLQHQVSLAHAQISQLNEVVNKNKLLLSQLQNTNEENRALVHSLKEKVESFESPLIKTIVPSNQILSSGDETLFLEQNMKSIQEAYIHGNAFDNQLKALSARAPAALQDSIQELLPHAQKATKPLALLISNLYEIRRDLKPHIHRIENLGDLFSSLVSHVKGMVRIETPQSPTKSSFENFKQEDLKDLDRAVVNLILLLEDRNFVQALAVVDKSSDSIKKHLNSWIIEAKTRLDLEKAFISFDTALKKSVDESKKK